MRHLIAVIALATLTACISNPNRCDTPRPTDPATETFASQLQIDLSQMTRTVNGVYYRDVVVGDGPELQVAREVEVFYVAYLKDGTIVDQQLSQPLQLNLQVNAAPGVTEGMLGMQVGGRRFLVVPSALALGACGKGPIPPNSTLVYEIELVAITP
jgi:peptidylprolyl isomerase